MIRPDLNTDPEDFLLNVNASLKGRAWVKRLVSEQERLAMAMVQQLGVSDPLSKILAGRGVMLEDVSQYIDPKLRDQMPDPYVLTDMEKGAHRIAKAIEFKEKTAIFGDYDVDGATSTALLVRFFRIYQMDVEVHIPDRQIEGYGPNIKAIERLAGLGVQLLITVDCGSTSFEPLNRAKELGMDVLVIDHHQTLEKLPNVDALINPNRLDDLSGLTYLAAVGVTFMTLVAVNRLLRDKHQNKPFQQAPLMQWLALVALGTVCDVVPLQGLNRPFVTLGLAMMAEDTIPGITALRDVAEFHSPYSTYALGFVIGPRINSSGRISKASLGAQILSSDDPDACNKLALQLNELNVARKKIEVEAIEAAIDKIGIGAEQLEDEDIQAQLPPVLMVASSDWHVGVVGLVAARLKDAYRRPVFAISWDKNQIGTGSGRSIYGVDLGAAILEAVEKGFIQKGGGHAMAAGLTLHQEQLSDLHNFLNEHLEASVLSAQNEQHLKIDALISAAQPDETFIDEMEKAGPFGAGNPRPVFVLPYHYISFAKPIGGEKHLRCTIKSKDNRSLSAIAFNVGGTRLGQALIDAAQNGNALHLAGFLEFNYWQGRRNIQFQLTDAAFAS